MSQKSLPLNPVNEKVLVEDSSSVTKLNLEPKVTPVSPFKLFKYASLCDIVLILVATISSLLNGISQPLLFLVFSNVIGLFGSYQKDSLVNPQKAGETLQLAVNDLSLTFVIIGAVTFVAAYLQMTLWSIIGERQSLRIRNEYYQSVLSQEMGWFDQHSSGDVATRLAGSVNLVQEGISDKLGLLLQYFTTFVGGFILAFIKGWKLTLVLLCVVPLLAACGMVFGKMLANTAQDQGAYGSAGSIASEVLAAIRTVYSFNATKRELQRYTKAISDARRVSIKKSILSGLSMGLVMGVLFCSYALAMWYGGQLIKNGDSDPQEVLTVFFNVLIGAMTLGQTSPSISALASAQGAAANLFSIIERESKINPFTSTDDMKKIEAQISPVKGKLEIKGVTFSYPSRPDTTVLKDVSFSIPSGSTVALVGHSGSGKSTSVGLIERFYDPDQGQVLLDGVDISTISTHFLRENIGLVGQEPVLFATTIKNNILFGLPPNVDITSGNLQSQVEEACKKAMIHDFIMSLPNQYDTLVGEKGSQLSGGQKQRIAIARAIIKNPRILLLDEATSALDTESERSVQAALDAASQDRTTVIIAHRLSTIKHANLILVFDKGTIVEQGDHSELLAMKGLYHELVEAQAIRTESDQLLLESSLESAKEKLNNPVKNDESDQPHIMNIQPELDDNDGIFKMATKADTIPDEAQLRLMRLKKEPLPILRILKLTAPWKGILSLGLLGAIADGSVFPVYSAVLTRATQSFFDIMTPGLKEKGLSDNAFWSVMFVVLAAGCCLAGLLKIGALYTLGDHVTYDIRQKSFKAMLNQEVAYYDDPLNNVGSLTARLSTEAEQVQGLVSKVLGALVSALSCVVIGLSLALSNGWKLALVALACLPLTAFGQLMELSSMSSGNSKTRKIYLKVSQIAMESIVNIRTVSGLARENLFFEDYLTRVDKAHKVATKGFLSSGIGYGIAMGSPHLTNALIFWYGTTLVVSGEYTYLSMFQVIMAIMFMGMSIGFLSAEMSTFVKSKVAAIEVFELWDRVPSIDSSPDTGLRHKSINGNLNLESAHFSYPSRPDVPVLQGLNLSVIENKKVALVGASGSGKSTIVSLAQRFYDLPRGSLSMEGTPIKDWNVDHLRSHIAMVGQEPVLFDMSIAENIAYGSETPVTQDDIERVAKMANAHDFITALPEGYQTRTGERGSQISGGQKQRIAIARALIRQPKLLLLDEATSALDSQSEHLVQQALDRASENRTTITIAHRLSTVQDADLIIVMRQGRCVESGTHDHLLSLQGYYYSLVHQQSLAASNPSN